MFLGEDPEEEIGTLARSLSAGSGAEPAERVPMKNILQQHLDKVSGARGEGPAHAQVLVSFHNRVCVLLASIVKKNIPLMFTLTKSYLHFEKCFFIDF